MSNVRAIGQALRVGHRQNLRQPCCAFHQPGGFDAVPVTSEGSSHTVMAGLVPAIHVFKP
jgi:hypothetical protein